MRLSFALVFTIMLLAAAPVFAQTDTTSGTPSSPDSLVEMAWQAVHDTYHDAAFNGVDWMGVRNEFTARDYASVDDTHAAIEAMLARLNDPAVRFLEADEASALLHDFSAQGGPGVGLMELLSVDVDEQTHRLTVVTPVPGTPAARAGLQPGDVITAIDGVATDGLPLHEAAALLRGEAGTTVTLTIRRGEEAFGVPLPREDLPARTRAVHPQFNREHGRAVGYLGLEQFIEGAAQQARDAVADLTTQGARGFVLDLRNNPGGFIPEVVGIAEVFLDPDRLVGILSARGDTLQALRTTEAALTDAPLVVLVNDGSASAAEVLAGALQAHDRAMVVGAHTFGKGLAHTLQPLPDGSAVMLPMARVVTPSGRDVLRDGIAPDVIVEADTSPVLDQTIEVAGPDDVLYHRAVDVLR